jgi:hypothetical protein
MRELQQALIGDRRRDLVDIHLCDVIEHNINNIHVPILIIFDHTYKITPKQLEVAYNHLRLL